MTTPVEPNIDAYGTYARAGALADWVEVAALAGETYSRADLEDLIDDNGWTTLHPRQFVLAEEFGGELPPEEWVDAVVDMLAERMDVLGALYPFEVSDSWRVTLRSDASTYCPYIAVLCIAVAHAWKIASTEPPEELLELIAVRALQDKGLAVVGVGTADRAGVGFAANLRSAADALGLRSQPIPNPANVHAKDAGVDTLAMVGWTDLRPGGQWLKIGQATTASSNEWAKKLGEPRQDLWKDYLLEVRFPEPFLVVPHHVQSDHLRKLVGATTGLVIDRLRLVSDLVATTANERGLVDSVLARGVDAGF